LRKRRILSRVSDFDIGISDFGSCFDVRTQDIFRSCQIHELGSNRKRVTLNNLWGHLGLRIHRSQLPALDGIRSAQEFRAILDRERARVNRNGHEFSLVVFDLGSVSPDSAHARRVADGLKRRLRAIDEIGWFDERRIGVVLPYTAPEGALKVADDVTRTISNGNLAPSYTVYTYPSRWMAGDNPDPQRQIAAISLKGES
jgi:hypothetical protein